MARILAVEDDRDIQELLENFLADAGHEVTLAGDGVEALSLFGNGDYELVLLDLMLPKIDGYGVCEVIRRHSMVPVVMLTALDGEEQQLRGFDLLVDDYITKPFSMRVLLRKIEAVLRRAAAAPESGEGQLSLHGIELDAGGRRVTAGGAAVELTQREFELLCELMKHPGRVLTRQILLERLWEHDFFGDERVVDTHIKNLRKKLGNLGGCIETVRGMGYRIDK